MKAKRILQFIVYSFLFVVNCLLPTFIIAQTPGEWTWMHGDNTPNSPGVFGTQGVPSPTNTPPALYEPCEWKDSNGNFWLFGGSRIGDQYSALWKYEIATNQWTWMKGLSTPNQYGVYGIQGISSYTNAPGARGSGSVTWTDNAGNLWMFGGVGYAAAGTLGFLNDLWKYNIVSNEWTWIKGSNVVNDPGSYGTQAISSLSNLPPSRNEIACSWTDNAGNLWLYGGSGTTCYPGLGDLWKYDITTNEWTWMHGASTCNPPAVYGMQGVATPSNTPGGRWVHCSWTDLSGNLWLFGGHRGSNVYSSDLWKYDIAINQWTWMKGPNTPGDPGNYGTKCVSTPNNMPSGRMENRARVRDACGNFWNIGGSSSGGGRFNDLWHYNVSTNEWTWVSGDSIINQTTVYGSQTISNPSNKLGAKAGSVGWIDNNGYIWVFGGSGMAGVDNDLFRYVPDPACISSSAVVNISPSTTICNGQSTTLVASGGTSYSWSPSGQSASSIVVSPGISTTYTVISNTFCGSKSATVTVTVSQLPAITTSPNNPAICSGQNVTLSVSGGTNYSWSPGGQNTSSIIVSPAASTIYTVTDSNACGSVSSSVAVAVNNSPTAIVSSTNVLCNEGSDGSATIVAADGTWPYTYLWSPPAGGTGPVATGLSAGVYIATIIDASGCSNAQTVTIDPPASTEDLYLPNAFSPNNDGENDMLQVYYSDISCIKAFKLVIYDRWGGEVFETTDPDFKWSGIYRNKLMNAQLLTYSMHVQFISQKLAVRKGNISLIR